MVRFKPLLPACRRPDRSRPLGAVMVAAVSGVGICSHSVRLTAADSNWVDRVDGRSGRRPLAGLRKILGDAAIDPTPVETSRRRVLRGNAASPRDYGADTAPFLDRARVDSRDRPLGPRRLHIPHFVQLV